MRNETNRQSTRLRLVVVHGLHGGEQQHLLDVVAVGQEHGETIDAEAPATGGREAVLHGDAEVLVEALRLLVAVALVLGLLHEALALGLFSSV